MVSSSFSLESDFSFCSYPSHSTRIWEIRRKLLEHSDVIFMKYGGNSFIIEQVKKKSHIPAGKRKKGGWEGRVTGLHKELLNEEGREE